MAFSNILIGTFVVYFIYYATNIIYDMFIAGMSSTPQSTEEEIIINDLDTSIPTTSFFPEPDTSSSLQGEEEIARINLLDIESEVENLPPIITIEKQEQQGGLQVTASSTEVQSETEENIGISYPAMNGGIEIDDLFQQVCTSNTPDDLAYLSQNWNNHLQ